jgi:hypothetical protein
MTLLRSNVVVVVYLDGIVVYIMLTYMLFVVRR